MPVPADPKIYHITHVDNLQSIVSDGGLLSDTTILSRGGPKAAIGMSTIKERRLSLPVKCYASDCVGDYVPFYFCPRSVMLYVIYRGNHPELTYQGGQGPIVHLEADLREVVEWADSDKCRWAFSLSNAGAVYAQFRNDLADLDQLNWGAINATDFQAPDVKEGKQAEFVVRDFVPWHLITRIGVRTVGVQSQVLAAIQTVNHQPEVQILPGWYY